MSASCPLRMHARRHTVRCMSDSALILTGQVTRLRERAEWLLLRAGSAPSSSWLLEPAHALEADVEAVRERVETRRADLWRELLEVRGATHPPRLKLVLRNYS
jgi:hypothetical protein